MDCIVFSLGHGTKRKSAGNYRAAHVAKARVLASEVIFGFASPCGKWAIGNQAGGNAGRKDNEFPHKTPL